MGDAKEIIDNLFSSFQALERRIEVARQALSGEQPTLAHEILLRLKSYEEAVEKQRRLAEKLCDYIQIGHWTEVLRHVKLINGFSTVVYADAMQLTEDLGAAIAPTESVVDS